MSKTTNKKERHLPKPGTDQSVRTAKREFHKAIREHDHEKDAERWREAFIDRVEDIKCLCQMLRRSKANTKRLTEALKPFAAMHREGTTGEVVVLVRGRASDRTILTNGDFTLAAEALSKVTPLLPAKRRAKR